MRFPTPATLSALLLTALASGLSGCLFSGGEPVAQGGAQDFPNTVSLGIAASSHISDHTQWDQFSVIPSSLPTFQDADSLVVAPESLYQAGSAPSRSGPAPTQAGAALAKTGAASGKSALSDTVYWDYSDTATLGVARRIHEQETAFKLKGDTLTFRWDDQARDSVRGNELVLESRGADLWKATDRRQAYRYTNTDSSGGFDRALFVERLPALLPAGFRIRVLAMTPGPDGAFGSPPDPKAKADNRPAYYAYARTRTRAGAAADTLELFEITDADADGVLWGDGDSGTVDFRQSLPAPPLRPAVASITQKMRAILFKAEQKTYPISFRETREEKDGKAVVFSVKGARNGADSTFGPGDTVTVSVHVTNPPDSRLREKHARYRIVLSGEPKRYADNEMLRYSLDATWMKDSLVSTHFAFTPDHPVQSRELSVTGDLELNADFADGHHAAAAGRYEGKTIDVILTDMRKEGDRRFHLQWDAVGQPLLTEPSN